MATPSPSPTPSADGCDISHEYGYAAIPIVFLLSLGGTTVPSILNRLHPEWDILHSTMFRFFQGVAGGFIASVALIHCLPDGSERLEEVDNLPDFAWAGLFALMGLLLTWTCEVLIQVYITQHAESELSSPSALPSCSVHTPTPEDDMKISETNEFEQIISHSDCTPQQLTSPPSTPQLSTHSSHGHGHGHEHSFEQLISSQSVMEHTTLIVLVFGLSFHSIFVGFAIGLENQLALFLAVLCHQFFEGLAIGLHLVHHQLTTFTFFAIVLIFSFSAPVGAAVGIGVSASICSDPVIFNFVSGMFNSVSAGILVYVACVHMITEEFNKAEVVRNPSLAIVMWSGVMVGATGMSIIGLWA